MFDFSVVLNKLNEMEIIITILMEIWDFGI